MEDKKEFVAKFLNSEGSINNQKNKSMFILLLISARKLSGRNINTGIYEMNEIEPEIILQNTYIPIQFSGLINYLIILEQIGSIFLNKNTSKNRSSFNGIYLALNEFSELEDEKIRAIISLRNSLVHKFGLSTEVKDKKQAFRFSISIESNQKIIDPKQWSGNFDDKSEDSLTIVYLQNLIDLIEKIILKVRELWENDQLVLRISGSIS